jgi:hypothetical protein
VLFEPSQDSVIVPLLASKGRQLSVDHGQQQVRQFVQGGLPLVNVVAELADLAGNPKGTPAFAFTPSKHEPDFFAHIQTIREPRHLPASVYLGIHRPSWNTLTSPLNRPGWPAFLVLNAAVAFGVELISPLPVAATV